MQVVRTAAGGGGRLYSEHSVPWSLRLPALVCPRQQCCVSRVRPWLNCRSPGGPGKAVVQTPGWDWAIVLPGLPSPWQFPSRDLYCLLHETPHTSLSDWDFTFSKTLPSTLSPSSVSWGCPGQFWSLCSLEEFQPEDQVWDPISYLWNAPE